MRTILPALLLPLLAACGGSGAPGNASDDEAANAAPQPATGAASVACDSLPDFVPLQGDAVVTTCTSGPGAQPNHVSGTVIYSTATAPAAVVAWYKGRATAAGLAQRFATEGPTATFSAGEGTKRSIMVLTTPGKAGAGAEVTVNWGRDTPAS